MGTRKFHRSTFMGEFYFREDFIMAMSNSNIPYSIRNDYGDMIINGLGYNVSCIHFEKCKENGFVNIGWAKANGEEYFCSFSARELADKLQHKIYHVEMEVSDEKY